MKGFAIFFVLVVFATLAHGQDEGSDGESRIEAENGQAVLDVSFPETEAVPGQPLELRLTVLVPTYLPTPPVWPGLEAPNLLVRLPERATNPRSEQVDGETWSGVSRLYRISPMVPGSFSIPPQDVTVTYADPDTNEPVKATLTTPPLGFSGILPPGADNLDPFIAATSLELEQTVDGIPGEMKPGDSITRTLVATVSGTSPMFLPNMLTPDPVDGVAAYPDEPVMAETNYDGVAGGTRKESITYVAEGGGTGEAVTIEWYNLSSETVETASVEGVSISVVGPPAKTAAEPRNWRLLAITGVAGLAALVSLMVLFRKLRGPLSRFVREHREARLASEQHAWRELRKVVASRNNSALRPAMDVWAVRVSGTDPRQFQDVQNALMAIGAAKYGRNGTGSGQDPWRMLDSALSAVRDAAHHRTRAADALPALNRPV